MCNVSFGRVDNKKLVKTNKRMIERADGPPPPTKKKKKKKIGMMDNVKTTSLRLVRAIKRVQCCLILLKITSTNTVLRKHLFWSSFITVREKMWKLNILASWAKAWTFADGKDLDQNAQILQSDTGSMPSACYIKHEWDLAGRICIRPQRSVLKSRG